MDLCRKIQNAVCWAEKKIQVELSLLKFLFSSVSKRPLFTQSGSSTESRHVPSSSSSSSFALIDHLLLVTPPVHPLNRKYSSFRRAVFLRGLQEYVQLPVRFVLSERLSRGVRARQATSVPFFMYDSSRTSLRGSLLFFFYFEVEFPHRCLSRKKTKQEEMSKTLFHPREKGEEKKNNADVCQCMCLSPCSSLTHLSLCLFSGWTLTLVWPSPHSLHHTLPACETCNKQKEKRSVFRLSS